MSNCELQDLSDWCAQQLSRATADPKSPFRWPVLCSATEDNIGGRVVVLRQFNPEERRLVFYTDFRSEKCGDIRSNPKVECVFFDRRPMIQLRVSGSAELQTDGDLWNNHYERIADANWQDYAFLPAPGSVTQSPKNIRNFKDLAAENFCLVVVSILKIDWLSLSRDGHRRALLDWSKSDGEHTWLVP